MPCNLKFLPSNCKYAEPARIFHRPAPGAGFPRSGDHNQFMPLEIKSGATFSSDWTAALRKLSALFGDAVLPPGIVYGGDGILGAIGGCLCR